jgi:hypothetical protein
VLEAKQEHRQNRVEEERRKSRNSQSSCPEVYKIAFAGAYGLISLAAAVVAVVAAAALEYSGS